MSDYTMAQAKRDFQRGMITGGTLVMPLPAEGGYWVLLDGLGGFGGPLVDARTKQVRYFRTTDAALNALHQIGFSPAASLTVGRER